jgi:hypothetical protein
MTTSIDLPEDRSPDWLDQALQASMTPPALPSTFRLGLMLALQQERLQDLQARQRALEEEHQRRTQRVREGYVRLRRETLAWVVGVAFACGALATQALPWLQAFTGLSAASLMPTLATLAACATGLGVWWWRLR